MEKIKNKNKTKPVDANKNLILEEILGQLSVEMTKWHKDMLEANSFKNKFIGGLLTGLGTVLGATLLVALVLYVLAQLASIEMIRPFVEEIAGIVQNSKR